MNSILNFRTFDHLKTKDNTGIRAKKLFRSSAPEYGTEKDFSELHSLQIDTIFDFRDDNEKLKKLQKPFDEQFNRQSTAISLAKLFNKDEIKELSLTEKNIDEYYHEVYQRLPIHYSAQYQSLTNGLNQGQTVLFHCSAGKDRTGFAAYLILSALNVHSDDIMEDYLRSNETAFALYEARKSEKDHLMNMTLTDEQIQLLFGVKEEYLHSAMQTIRESHKSCERYLKEVLHADIDAIRSAYLI